MSAVDLAAQRFAQRRRTLTRAPLKDGMYTYLGTRRRSVFCGRVLPTASNERWPLCFLFQGDGRPPYDRRFLVDTDSGGYFSYYENGRSSFPLPPPRPVCLRAAIPAFSSRTRSTRFGVATFPTSATVAKNKSGRRTWKRSVPRPPMSAPASRPPPTRRGCRGTCCWRRRRGGRPWSGTPRRTASAKSWERSVTLLVFLPSEVFVETCVGVFWWGGGFRVVGWWWSSRLVARRRCSQGDRNMYRRGGPAPPLLL